MNRRTFLGTVVGSVAVVSSGCLAQRSNTDAAGQNGDTTPATGENATRENGTNERDAGNTGDGNPAKSEPGSNPTLIKRSFNIVSSVCGKGKSETRVSFDGRSVRVTGTISGQNSCYTAKLKNATLEGETLTVNVQSFQKDTNELCSMCLKEIKYDAMCTFENELPKRVVVIHNDSHVTSETRT